SPPILVHGDGSIERLATGGPVLGPFANASYEQREIPLARGDRLILFTDGITEVRPAGGDPDAAPHVEFGEEALIALAREHRACAALPLHPRHHAACEPLTLRPRLSAAVSAYAGRSFQDDATLMVLAVN